MDDTLEIPRPRTENIPEGDDHSSGDEDGGLDWTKLRKLGATARPIIPKRGEKDFEPAPGGGSGLQLHVLDRSRDAMLEALRANRTISSKTTSYGIWYPSIDRVHVTAARGIHFSTMGHSASRTVQYDDTNSNAKCASSKLPKRLELLPEEALYLIERGALFCYKSVSNRTPFVDPSNYETQSPGAPMSVQQAFAEMIGCEGITLEHYQVYAYLKRLGFILIRAEPPTSEYPVAPPPVLLPTIQTQSVARRLTGLFSCFVSNVISVFGVFHWIDWWRRLRLRRQETIQGIFRSLRFIPCGYSLPLYRPPVKPDPSSTPSTPSPYKIFYHVYKPSTPFRKSAPPVPDFYVVVVNARTTFVPSLEELTVLFNVLPEMPLPPPRKRGILASHRQSDGPGPTSVRPTAPEVAPQEGSLARVTIPSRQSQGWCYVPWTSFQHFISSFRTAPAPSETKPTLTPRKPNPFLALKTGKKTVVIAAVDAGNISFFRFGQGVFEEWPMI